MFGVSYLADKNRSARLTAGEVMTSSDFDELAEQLGSKPMKARKVGFVAAQRAKKEQVVETLWNGIETRIAAKVGDWVVTNLRRDLAILRDQQGEANIYVIRADKFPTLYKRHQGDNEYGDIYRAISQVECLYLEGGFEIMAPWGEMQRADRGYILRNGTEIYGNHKQTFEETYELIV